MYHAQLSKNGLDAHFSGALVGRKVARPDAPRRLWMHAERPFRGPPSPVVFISAVLLARTALETAICDAGWRAETFSSKSALTTETGDPVPSCLVLDLSSTEDLSLLYQRPRASGRDDMPVICLAAQGDVPM